MKNFIWRIRERINIFLFDSKNGIAYILQILSILLMLFVIGSTIYYYGFPETERSINFNTLLLKYGLIFYLVRFFILLFYNFHPLHFIKKRGIEGIVLLLFSIDAIVPNFFDHLLVIDDLIQFNDTHSLLIYQCYFFIISIWELRTNAPKIGRINLSPTQLLVASFALLISIGTGLLLLPEMTTGHSISFIDALFTATSASCVTGLVVVDTATFFSFKGQIVILALIQLGGINIISFAAFFTILSRKMGGLKYQSLLKDILSADKLSDAQSLLKNILKWTFIIEVIGSIALYFSWENMYFSSIGERIYYSIFHTISAFNNAGFALYTDNLYQIGIHNMIAFQLIIAILVIAGGLGFFVLQDVFRIHYKRKTSLFRWKEYSVMTRISIRMTAILLFIGTLTFFLLERNGTLLGSDIPNQLVLSFFQSMSTRTAGFNTVDINLLSTPVLMLFIILMFIGAGSGSTAGGIKITTLAVALKASLATIQGKSYVDFFKRTIPYSIVNRAFSIIIFALAVTSISIFALTITEPNTDFIKIVFEEISAFATVGLSTGITAGLTDISKIIIISSMFIGRVGILSVAMILSQRVISRNYQHAKESITVG